MRLLNTVVLLILASVCFVQVAAAAAPQDSPLRKQYEASRAKIKPEEAQKLFSLAQWCHTQGLRQEALDSLTAALKVDPNNKQYQQTLQNLRALQRKEGPAGLLSKRRVAGYEDESAWYHLSIPEAYRRSNDPLPLFIYLHGGHHNAGSADEIVALAQILEPFKQNLVLFPNHLKTWWAHPREMLYLLNTLEQVMQQWQVDPQRIYLMGGSMGGNGVWAWGCQCPELFAGLSPISGFYEDFLGFELKNVVAKPIYVLHGTDDKTVPVKGAQRAHELLKNAGAKQLELRLPNCGHQVPVDEINKSAVWLLQHKNSQTFELQALKARVQQLPVPGWLKKYEGT